jgi:uncharacterized protein
VSDSEESRVFLSENDEEMQGASQKARATFRYFWREVAWERRRIVPALNLACVKAPFSDGEGASPRENRPEVEHMWLDDVDFDGRFVTGTLLNSPTWLKTVKEGDSASLRLDEISDWMYVISGEVYGAYTVNLMRSRMEPRERKEHDAAWGLNFGNPETIRVVPDSKRSAGFLKSLFSKPETRTQIQEHPMSEAMAPSLKDQLAKDPSMLRAKDDRGWTLLHHQALAGSTATVKVLLEAGADPRAVTDHGMTPMDLANALDWQSVVALLRDREST